MARLIDYAPHWITFPNIADGVRFYFGVSFINPMGECGPCPTCSKPRDERLAVSFWPPIDPDGLIGKISLPPEQVTSQYHHRASGETFDTLTIVPSIGLDPRWHGNITNGEIAPAKSR